MYSVVTAFWFITASRFRSGSTSSSSGMAPNNNRGAVGLEIDDAFSVGCVPCLLPPPPPAPLPQSSTTAERLLSPASSLLVFSACSNRMSWFLRALCRDYGVWETIYFRVGCSRQAPRCSFSGTACLIPITQGARIITCRAVVHEALCAKLRTGADMAHANPYRGSRDIMVMAVALFSIQASSSSPGYLVLAICQHSMEYGAVGYHQNYR